MSPSRWARQAEVIAKIDGASRGNPGPAAYGVVMETAEGAPLAAFSKFLGHATNNFAEYQALLAALGFALEHRHLHLKVISDSELLTRQIEGSYKVKSPDLKPLHERSRELIAKLKAFAIVHLPREQNRQADRLANQALDAAKFGGDSKPVSKAFPSSTSEPLRTPATYRQGILKPHRELSLAEGEEVELEVRRRKNPAR